MCAEQRQIGALGVAHVQPCRSAQEWLLKATTDAFTNGAAKLIPLCDARRCGPRCTETYSAAFPMQSSLLSQPKDLECEKLRRAIGALVSAGGMLLFDTLMFVVFEGLHKPSLV